MPALLLAIYCIPAPRNEWSLKPIAIKASSIVYGISVLMH